MNADVSPLPAAAAAAQEVSPLRFDGTTLHLLDQTRLPLAEEWLACTTVPQVADAIKRLAVRGAPAIGVAAAYGLVLGVAGAPDVGELRRRFDATHAELAATRPTAVNLRWALDRGREVVDAALADPASGSDPDAVRARLRAWAEALHAADVDANRRIGAHGAALFAKGDRVLTHCNAGALATAGWGTALGVIRAAFERGAVASVWVDETRPLLQGARLTAWELGRLGIPYRLVTDNTAGLLMWRGEVDRIVVGADRIARNGDTANKIGTYAVAVLARHHGVPFYVAAPRSTIDVATPTGREIPIEERSGDEVTRVFGQQVAPADARTANFAFDVTPAELIAGIITEVGVLRPPYAESIAAAMKEKA